MIQSVLLFLMGFLSAGLLALLLLPAVWNRAVGLTKRGIEAALPTTLEEINARADQLRARHAVELRKVEQQRDDAARKAATVMVDSGRSRAKFAEMAHSHGELKQHSQDLELEAQDLRAALKAQDARLADLGIEARMAKEGLSKSQSELNRIGGLYEEAALTSSANQVKVVEQEEYIDDLRRQLSAGMAQADARKQSQNIPAKDATRLQALEDENRRLLSELAQARQAAIKSDRDRVGEDRDLRETMLDLAAQVVRATARDPEQAVAIERALATPARNPGGAKSNIVSLAERIKKNPD